jgi:3-dehydroquinate synthase
VGSGAAGALDGLLPRGCREVALVGDSSVMGLYGEPLARRLEALAGTVHRLSFPPGEASKTRETKAVLEDRLLEAGATRGLCVVALGGGISLDLGGFLAATYLRGVDWIAVPTSLLAQVDAAVGGKTAVNTPRGKNLVGAFHQPAAIAIDPTYLSTLAPVEWRAGLAELVKTACVADAALFAWIEGEVVALGAPHVLDERFLERCVGIKADLVVADEREAGPRAYLNFGHTIGHALEKASAHALRHGEAVASGMVVEAELARRLCGLPDRDASRLVACLAALGLETRRPSLPFAALAPFLGADKKRRAGRVGEVELALPRRIGEMAGAEGAWTVAAPLALLEEAWEARA